jgi:hypothetical protein
MNTYNQSIVTRKILSGAVLLAVFIAAFGTGSLPLAHAQISVSNNPSQTSDPDMLGGSVLSDGQFVYVPNIGDVNVKTYLEAKAPHLPSYAAGLYRHSEYYSINSIQRTSSVSIQKVAKVAPKNITGYEFGDLPLNAHNAMIDAVKSRPTGILDGGTYFVVGHYESDEIWGIGHLGAAVGTVPPDWGTSVWFIVQTKNTTQVALQGTSLFTEFMIDLPMSFKDQIDMQSKKRLSAQATTFLFPWDKSQQWWYSYGWHGGTNLALDFAPTNVITPNNMWILASASGTVTLVCSDPYQAAIDLSTPDGVMDYRHIDYNSFIAQNVKDKAVTQGRKLSLLYNGTEGAGYYNTSQNYPWPTCAQGSSPSCTYIKYSTYCGAGTGAHVHWTLPSKPFTVDGWQVDVNGLWTKSGQTSKNVGALFTSTNPPSLIPISGNTGIGGATLSYTDGTLKTATADGSGNYSFSVPSGWSGTVTPFRANYIFSPSNKLYANILENQTQNYTVTDISTWLKLFLPLILR